MSASGPGESPFVLQRLLRFGFLRPGLPGTTGAQGSQSCRLATHYMQNSENCSDPDKQAQKRIGNYIYCPSEAHILRREGCLA